MLSVLERDYCTMRKEGGQHHVSGEKDALFDEKLGFICHY